MSSFEESKEKAKSHNKLLHYTDFNALKSIIEDKSLRLTNIRYLNDKFENEYLPRHLEGKIYIASFTHREKESYFFGVHILMKIWE